MKDDEEIDSGYDIFKDSGDEDLFFDDIIKRKLIRLFLNHWRTTKLTEK